MGDEITITMNVRDWLMIRRALSVAIIRGELSLKDARSRKTAKGREKQRAEIDAWQGIRRLLIARVPVPPGGDI